MTSQHSPVEWNPSLSGMAETTIKLCFSQIPPLFSKPTFCTIRSSSISLNLRQHKINSLKLNVAKPSGLGLYSSAQLELTPENVDEVLDNVRPYLIADGGNVDVVAVDNGVVSLKLQGACGSCPSSTTTMKMGIERVLKEKFGDAIKEICQVNDQPISGETTVDAVNAHLNILRPAIKNYGGTVNVLSIVGGDCLVNYVGPETIGSGIKAAIKERFPDILNVNFTDQVKL